MKLPGLIFHLSSPKMKSMWWTSTTCSAYGTIDSLLMTHLGLLELSFRSNPLGTEVIFNVLFFLFFHCLLYFSMNTVHFGLFFLYFLHIPINMIHQRKRSPFVFSKFFSSTINLKPIAAFECGYGVFFFIYILSWSARREASRATRLALVAALCSLITVLFILLLCFPR